jgi:GT2 family glycosyltransferase
VQLVIITLCMNDLIELMRTKKSILSQLVPVEWIIVTPFNNSPTYKYVEQLHTDGIVKKIIPDEGVGIYPAMNAGIAGIDDQNWIWFINAGDQFPGSKTYVNVIDYINQTRNRWIYGGHFLGSDRGEILGEIQAPEIFKISNQLFSKKYISHQSTIFSSKFIKELGGFRTDLKIAADWDLMARASLVDSGQRISETISIFYMGGLSTVSRQVGNEELLSIRNRYLSKYYLPKSYLWFYYRVIRNYFVRLGEVRLPKVVNWIRRFRFILNSLKIK